MNLQRIRISDVLPPDVRVRSVGSESAFLELVQSIQEHGLIHPIVVIPEGDRYRLVSGDRRLRACTVLGQEDIEAKVADYTPEEAAIIRMHENVNREDPNPVDVANYLRANMDHFGWNQSQAAAHCGKSPAWVSQHLRLLELDDDSKRLVFLGELSIKHGYLAARIQDEETRRIWTEHWARFGVSSAVAEEQVQRLEDSEALQAQEPLQALEGATPVQMLHEPERCHYCGSTQKESPLLLVLTCDFCRTAMLRAIELEGSQGA